MPEHAPLDFAELQYVKDVLAALAAAGVTSPPDPAEIGANAAFSGLSPEALAAHFVARAAADGDPSGYQSFVKDHSFATAQSEFKRKGGHPVVNPDGTWQVRKDPDEQP